MIFYNKVFKRIMSLMVLVLYASYVGEGKSPKAYICVEGGRRVKKL